jgi:hypothetical protein
MGEMGRDRNAKHVTTKGMREVIIYKGPRDNFEETSQIYLDEDGPIGGKIVRETANRVIVEYPEKNFKANQLKAEELAMRRVSQAAPVSDGAVTRNVVAKKEAASLDQLFADAEANATENMQREKADERILAAAEVAFDG